MIKRMKAVWGGGLGRRRRHQQRVFKDKTREECNWRNLALQMQRQEGRVAGCRTGPGVQQRQALCGRATQGKRKSSTESCPRVQLTKTHIPHPQIHTQGSQLPRILQPQAKREITGVLIKMAEGNVPEGQPLHLGPQMDCSPSDLWSPNPASKSPSRVHENTKGHKRVTAHCSKDTGGPPSLPY